MGVKLGRPGRIETNRDWIMSPRRRSWWISEPDSQRARVPAGLGGQAVAVSLSAEIGDSVLGKQGVNVWVHGLLHWSCGVSAYSVTDIWS